MEIISRLLDLTTRGESFCLVTVILSADPEVPVGGKMIVFPDGSTEGQVGPARLGEAARASAMQVLADKKKRTVKIAEGLQIFLDIPSTDVKLLICGAGHIALPLARFAREVGFRVLILDDRPDYAHPSRFPGCEVLTEDFTTALRKMNLGPATYVVVITRGHEHDEECLAEILRQETAYTGLIGSRRRVRFVLSVLGKKGIPPERLKKVFTPIGMPIGAESPEEIALAIASELVCVRRKGDLAARKLRAASESSS